MSVKEINIDSVNIQKGQSKNQIKTSKPDVIKNMNVLEGYIGNSCNGGMIKPICYMPVMAGSKIADYRIRLNLKMLTPRTPVFQKLKCVIKTFFVPNSRVWRNYEKFVAQRGGANIYDKIEEEPNFGGKAIPFIVNNDNLVQCSLVDTELWRDSWISSYIPRFQSQVRDGAGAGTSSNVSMPLPKYSALPARGFVAIYNDFLRNKEYDATISEFWTDTVDELEFYTYVPTTTVTSEIFKLSDKILRGKRQDSYYTNYRTDLNGFTDTLEITDLENQFDLNEYLKKVAENRSQAENAQKNDWDVISEIRGSKKLTQGKVQLLGSKVCGINYQAVTQDTYNINSNIEEQFQTLGEQGAFSFTDINVSMFDTQEFVEDGYLHTIIQITADSVFETAFERTGLNVRWDDKYRPDLVHLKDDVLYKLEKCGTGYVNNTAGIENLMASDGFKRRYSEYFKAPNCISGDVCTVPYYNFVVNNEYNEIRTNGSDGDLGTTIQTQGSYTFFEVDDRRTLDFKAKNIWQDYTDILINQNQAIVEDIEYIDYTDDALSNDTVLYKHGANQVFFVGMQGCVIDMPIDESIKNDFTKWGEK